MEAEATVTAKAENGAQANSQVDMHARADAAGAGSSAATVQNNFGGMVAFAICLVAILGCTVSVAVSFWNLGRDDSMRDDMLARISAVDQRITDMRADTNARLQAMHEETGKATTASWLVRNDVTTLRGELASAKVPVSKLFRYLPDRAPKTGDHHGSSKSH